MPDSETEKRLIALAIGFIIGIQLVLFFLCTTIYIIVSSSHLPCGGS